MWTQQLFHLKPATLRNAAHLHVIHKLIVIDKLKRPLWIRRKIATPTTHAI